MAAVLWSCSGEATAMPGSGYLLMLPIYWLFLTWGTTVVVQAWIRQGNLLPTNESAQSFACSSIAVTHETDYAKLRDRITSGDSRGSTGCEIRKIRKCCPWYRCLPRQSLCDTWVPSFCVSWYTIITWSHKKKKDHNKNPTAGCR